MVDIANLVFIAAKKYVTAIDGRTGDRLWTTEIPGSGWFSTGFMTLTADVSGVYAGRNGSVSCLDPVSGDILWTIKPPKGGASLPVIATMLGGPTDQTSMIAALQSQQANAAGGAAASG